MGELVDPLASVRAYLAAEKSANTLKAYASDWTHFSEWCGLVSEIPLPASPLVVARYLAQLADGGLKASSIERRVAAIRCAHKTAGHEPPTNAEGVKAVLRGIRRTKGIKPVRKAPATADLLERVLERLPRGMSGVRDRALLLVGFSGALRRSELVALDVDDVTFHAGGIILDIRKSKTDQEQAGARIPIARGKRLKPGEALQAWLNAAKIRSGPIFREVDRHGNVGAGRLTDRSVARVVKRAIRSAGLDASLFSGHSLRSGFVTTSLDSKVDPFRIMKTTRHKKVDTLRIYDRRENDFDSSAGSDFL